MDEKDSPRDKETGKDETCVFCVIKINASD